MKVYENTAGTLEVDHVKRTSNYNMKEHMHDKYELYCLMAGERDYFIRERTYRMEQGDFVFIEKGEPHRAIDTAVPNHERAVFYFTSSILDGLPIRGHSGVVRLSPQVRYKGEALVRELLSEAKVEAKGRDVMLELLLKQLLLLVFRAQEEQPESEDRLSPAHQMMSEVAAYIRSHYQEPLLLKEVAEQFFVSRYYLSRTFKQCTGFGFSEYVQLVRMREAQRLLIETDLKIIEVAEQTGIRPAANFYTLFKRMNGCSPLQYRKRQRALLTSH
ncbi:helix-turn-helix domain-containing protein [Marinicrinis lubricantis]|uniref:Helix-turn-helix domain-containing protein n=1 Tax=Marinicrinis lubricantis TaxID=2086470 RepID=A0ABW1IST9_9BACL